VKKNLVLPITCGEKTCGDGLGEMCEFVRQHGFGTRFLCGIYSQDPEGYTRYLKDKDGWLMRCEECLQTEEKQ